MASPSRVSPAAGSNYQVIQVLNERVTGLNVVFQELSNLYNSSPDLEFRRSVRPQLTELNEDILFMESERDALVASTEVVTPPSVQEIADVETALKQLDVYVRSDQNFHMSIAYLQQIAEQLKPKTS